MRSNAKLLNFSLPASRKWARGRSAYGFSAMYIVVFQVLREIAVSPARKERLRRELSR